MCCGLGSSKVGQGDSQPHPWRPSQAGSTKAVYNWTRQPVRRLPERQISLAIHVGSLFGNWGPIMGNSHARKEVRKLLVPLTNRLPRFADGQEEVDFCPSPNLILPPVRFPVYLTAFSELYTDVPSPLTRKQSGATLCSRAAASAHLARSHRTCFPHSSVGDIIAQDLQGSSLLFSSARQLSVYRSKPIDQSGTSSLETSFAPSRTETVQVQCP